MDGEIEEVENPVNPSGPSLFRFVMFKATEKVSHKKKVETDKAEDDTNDFGLTFDEVYVGWTVEASSQALQNTAAGMSLGSSAMSNAASASGISTLDKPVQASGKPGPPLAIEDAKERGRLLRKIEAALMGSSGLSLKLSKVIAQSPATVLGSNGKANMQDVETAVKEQESLLTHIIVNGTLPGQSSFIGVNDLTNVTKPFHVHLDDLTKAVDMASRGRKKVERQGKLM